MSNRTAVAVGVAVGLGGYAVGFALVWRLLTRGRAKRCDQLRAGPRHPSYPTTIVAGGFALLTLVVVAVVAFALPVWGVAFPVFVIASGGLLQYGLKR